MLAQEGWDEVELHDDLYALEQWRESQPPTRKEIEEQNESLLRDQRKFRNAARFVADAFAHVPAVRKVVLFGSVATPLKKEVPRFRRFRRHRVAVWHECRDVDLAVWVNNLDCLGALRKARIAALRDFEKTSPHGGVAQHQVEVFIMNADGGQHLGRLCPFGACPKGKPECREPNCGQPRFLQQTAGFRLYADALSPHKTVVLFDRESR